MYHQPLPGRASLFTAAALTLIATISLLGTPSVRAAVPLRSLDVAGTDRSMSPCAQSAAAVRAPQLRASRAQ